MQTSTLPQKRNDEDSSEQMLEVRTALKSCQSQLTLRHPCQMGRSFTAQNW